MMRRWIRFLSIGPALAGCAELTPFTRDVCGNGIVEPANGEECDTYPSATCGDPSTPAACRYRCSYGTNAMACPEGFGCGADDICRRASRTYEQGTFVSNEVTSYLAAGDYDGDGRTDLLTVGDDGTFAHLFESPDAPLAVLVTKRSDPGQSINLELAPGQRADDLVIVDTRVPDAYGIMIYEASDEKVFSPKFAAVDTAPVAPVVAAAVHTGLEKIPYGPDSSVLSGILNGKGILLSTAVDGDWLNLPSAAPIVSPMLVGSIDEDPARSPCDEVGILFQGASQIWFVPTCVRIGDTLSFNRDAANDPIATLPVVRQKDGALLDGAVLGDLDADGHLDVVAWAESGTGCATLYRAYGAGDGTFHSSPGAPPSAGDGLLDVFHAGEALTGGECVRKGSPLIVKDLNRDGKADVVTRDGIASQGSLLVDAGADKWEYAVVGDFDGDGEWDVVASIASKRGLRYLSGIRTYGIRRATMVATVGNPAALTVGDYDGDGVDDVAYVDRGPTPDMAQLEIAFGEPRGTFAVPKRLGLTPIDSSRLTSMRFGSPLATRDAISELLVVQPPESITFFAGDTERELAAPLDFEASYLDESTELKRTLVGRFGSDGRPAIASLCTSDAEVDRLTLELLTTRADGGADYRLKNLPMSPNAVPTAEGYKFTSYPAMVALDVDRDGVDEMVLVGNVRGAEASEKTIGVPGVSTGQLSLVRRGPVDSDPNWVFSPASIVGESFANDPLNPTDPNFVGSHTSSAIDVDGDGQKDLLTLGKLGPKTILALYRNDGPNLLDPTRRLVFHSDSTLFDTATGFVALAAAGSDRTRIVLLTTGGPFLADLDLVSGAVDVAQLTTTDAEVTDAVAGDFNADGVFDLALASSAGTRVMWGLPVVR